MSKVLHLTLKKKWFDMIASGEKKEEYREDKQFWRNRLLLRGETGDARLYHFVKFRNGYGKNAPTLLVECKGITAGKARPEWSDNWPGTVFIIKLGNIIPDKGQCVMCGEKNYSPECNSNHVTY